MTVELRPEVPEALKPRRIDIATGYYDLRRFEQFFLELESRAVHPSRDVAAIADAAFRFGVQFVGPPSGINRL